MLRAGYHSSYEGFSSASGGHIFYQRVKKRQRGRRIFQDYLAPNTLIRIIPWDRFRVLFIDDDGKERFLQLNAPLPKGNCFRTEAVGGQIQLKPIADFESASNEAFEMPDDYRPA